MMEQVRLCAVWPIENWLGSSLNQIRGWTTVRESYSRALEQGTLLFPESDQEIKIQTLLLDRLKGGTDVGRVDMDRFKRGGGD